MIAELVLTLALEMFPIQLPMTEKAYNDLQTIEVANPKTAADWFYKNKEENKWRMNFFETKEQITNNSLGWTWGNWKEHDGNSLWG